MTLLVECIIRKSCYLVVIFFRYFRVYRDLEYMLNVYFGNIYLDLLKCRVIEWRPAKRSLCSVRDVTRSGGDLIDFGIAEVVRVFIVGQPLMEVVG